VNPAGVGMGPNSGWKLDEYTAIVRAHAAIVANINTGRLRRGQSPFPYRGLDPTAGPGAYIQRKKGQSDHTLIGTPLRLVRACVEKQLDYRLGFIERESVWVQALKRRLEEIAAYREVDLTRIDVIEGNYEDWAERWVRDHVRPPVRGLISPDANGEFGYRTLCRLGALPQLQRVDYAIHASGSLLKWRRGRGAIQLGDALDACQKEHWFVGRVRTNWQWVWLFGTNWEDWPPLLRIGLVSLESEEGQARLQLLCTTRTERDERNQPRLLED
jgi:hypothetical protein